MYPHAQYQAAAARTAGPAQLVLMVYDAVLDRLGAAREALSDVGCDPGLAHHLLTSAQGLVDELAVSLDRERGGEVAEGLAALYAYCHQQLVEANLAKDPGPLADVEAVVGGLRDAWASACVGRPGEVRAAG